MGQRRHRVRATVSELLLHFDASHGPEIKAHGTPMRKEAVTWVLQIREAFQVQTNEGLMTAHPMDFVAYDEKSGHVWPVASSYVEQNYSHAQTDEQAPARPEDMGNLFRALNALEHAAGHLSAVDVSNAEANLADVRYRPLTQAVVEAAQDLRQHIQSTIGLVTEANVGLVEVEVEPQPASDPVKCPHCAVGYFDPATSKCQQCGYRPAYSWPS